VSRAYGAITPDPIENMVENAGDNLGAPADAINHLLQGDLIKSATMLGRFGVNSLGHLPLEMQRVVLSTSLLIQLVFLSHRQKVITF